MHQHPPQKGQTLSESQTSYQSDPVMKFKKRHAGLIECKSLWQLQWKSYAQCSQFLLNFFFVLSSKAKMSSNLKYKTLF